MRANHGFAGGAAPMCETLEARLLLAVVTVDTVAELMAAINNGAASDTVNIAAGTYVLDSPLQPKDGMTIQGAGKDLTILTGSTAWNPGTASLPDSDTDSGTVTGSAYLFNFPSQTTDVTISDMTIDGQSRLHGAIWGNDCDGLEVFNTRVDDFLWSGIRTYRLNNASFHDNEFIDAGGKVDTKTGGAIYGSMGIVNTTIYNNSFWRSAQYNREFYGIKGRRAEYTHIYNNTIKTNFSIELPFENDKYVEIDHNYISGTVSIPKNDGGGIPTDGYSFHIHHNYFKSSYSLEWSRNGAEIDHNLFDFATNADGGNLISSWKETSAGWTKFHDNLIKNPGRGIAWFTNPYNNFSFYNNEVIANTTITPRTEGLFGLPTATNFSTITIKDNIIECIGQARPLFRNTASYASNVENNTLINVSDSANYSNANTGAARGVVGDLSFNVGADEQYSINNWVITDNTAGSQPITIAEYTFAGNTTSPATVATGVTASAMTAGSGVTALAYTNGFRCADGFNSYNGSNINNGPDLNDYFAFTVQANSGTLSLSELQFKYISETSGPTRYQVRYSLTGFASDTGTIVASGTMTPGAAAGTSTTDLSGLPALQGVSGGIGVRIYMWGAASSSRYGGIDDVRLMAAMANPGSGTQGTVEYTFHDGSANTTNATTVASGVTASAMTAGSGVTALAYTNGFRCADGFNSYNGSNINNGPDLNDYFAFTVQANSGALDLSELQFKYISETSGPTRYQVRYSLTGFASDTGTIVTSGTMTPGAAAATSTTDLQGLAALQDVSGPIEFRIYMWGAASSSRYGGIDDVKLTFTL